MNIEEFWEGFTSSEKDLFQKSCRRLLKQTFIVRDRDEESKRAYYFISKNPEPFSVYLGYIGFDVLTDRENGVVMLRNCRLSPSSSSLWILASVRETMAISALEKTEFKKIKNISRRTAPIICIIPPENL